MARNVFSGKRRRWLSAGVLAGMIFVASSRSDVVGPPVQGGDKVVHFAVYGMLATLIVRALSPSGKRVGWRAAWGAIVLTSVYGISDEWHQSFTPGRAVEFADWLADTFGAALAVTLYCYWSWYRRALERPLFSRGKPRLEKTSLAGPVST